MSIEPVLSSDPLRADWIGSRVGGVANKLHNCVQKSISLSHTHTRCASAQNFWKVLCLISMAVFEQNMYALIYITHIATWLQALTALCSEQHNQPEFQKVTFLRPGSRTVWSVLHGQIPAVKLCRTSRAPALYMSLVPRAD